MSKQTNPIESQSDPHISKGVSTSSLLVFSMKGTTREEEEEDADTPRALLQMKFANWKTITAIERKISEAHD